MPEYSHFMDLDYTSHIDNYQYTTYSIQIREIQGKLPPEILPAPYTLGNISRVQTLVQIHRANTFIRKVDTVSILILNSYSLNVDIVYSVYRCPFHI